MHAIRQVPHDVEHHFRVVTPQEFQPFGFRVDGLKHRCGHVNGLLLRKIPATWLAARTRPSTPVLAYN
jgi:hypothetical protein